MFEVHENDRAGRVDVRRTRYRQFKREIGISLTMWVGRCEGSDVYRVVWSGYSARYSALVVRYCCRNKPNISLQ